MSETLLAAVISAISAIVVCVISNAIQHAASKKILDFRLGALETKMDKHNNLIERMFIVEKDIALLKDNVEDLKKNGGKA